MSKLPISVIVLTFNEQDKINICLKSIYDFFDEIFIVDSFSSDNTIKICKLYSNKIYKHKFENYSKQRNWAQDTLPIQNEWVFHLDADECVTPQLINELRKKLSNKTDGFIIKRKVIFLNRWIKHGNFYPSYHLRIFKKNRGYCENRLYDQHFISSGVLEVLNCDIVNNLEFNIYKWRCKHEKWANYEALEYINQTKKLNNVVKANKNGNPIERRRWLKHKYYKLPIFIRPFIYYFYRYFFKYGFLDGQKGLIYHFYQGLWFRFLVDVNIFKIRYFKKSIKLNEKSPAS